VGSLSIQRTAIVTVSLIGFVGGTCISSIASCADVRLTRLVRSLSKPDCSLLLAGSKPCGQDPRSQPRSPPQREEPFSRFPLRHSPLLRSDIMAVPASPALVSLELVVTELTTTFATLAAACADMFAATSAIVYLSHLDGIRSTQFRCV
jgi:hypothetical protein